MSSEPVAGTGWLSPATRSLRYRRLCEDPAVVEALERQPAFLAALIADTQFISARRGKPIYGASTARILLEAARLAARTDSYLAQIAWRLRIRLLVLGVPILPALLHRFAMIWAQVSIGESVVVRPGVSIAHGQVCIGGLVEIGREVHVSPFVSIGLVAGDYRGPRIGAGTHIGTGVRILGPVTVGAQARIGANAVVLDDVPNGATAVGVPARIVNAGA